MLKGNISSLQNPITLEIEGGYWGMVTDRQVRKLMEELSKNGQLGKAAMKAGMDRKTARKYKKLGRMPSEVKDERAWRTREDPFSADWPDVRLRLKDAPELEALALFEHLQEQKPGVYAAG